MIMWKEILGIKNQTINRKEWVKKKGTKHLGLTKRCYIERDGRKKLERHKKLKWAIWET